MLRRLATVLARLSTARRCLAKSYANQIGTRRRVLVDSEGYSHDACEVHEYLDRSLATRQQYLESQLQEPRSCKSLLQVPPRYLQKALAGSPGIFSASSPSTGASHAVCASLATTMQVPTPVLRVPREAAVRASHCSCASLTKPPQMPREFGLIGICGDMRRDSNRIA